MIAKELVKYSIAQDVKDPRGLLYNYPSLPIVKYAKMMQEYSFNLAVQAAESVAHYKGYILLPSSCMHWQRVKDNYDRRVKIGRNTFYLMRDNELTKSERQKLMHYIEDLQTK